MKLIKYIMLMVLTTLALSSAPNPPQVPTATFGLVDIEQTPVILDSQIRKLVVANWDTIDLKQALTLSELKLLKKDVRKNKVIIRTVIVKDTVNLATVTAGI